MAWAGSALVQVCLLPRMHPGAVVAVRGLRVMAQGAVHRSVPAGSRDVLGE